ncbi:hypothetical protein ACTXG7_09035 [Mycolicibacterium sp. Dal123E01]|uniref:hypothetical protein n=1 Tax=Mycolicibacterium sp. Dal123E01 TaxID=3457578 RepID=UPI00403E83C2
MSAPRDGQCFTNARPAGGSPTAAPPGGHSGQHGVRGTVTSVGANTVAVTPAGGGTPTNVGISDATTYAKRAPAGAEAISQGKCVTAGGTKDGSGTLQADVIALRPADNGSCPSMRH